LPRSFLNIEVVFLDIFTVQEKIKGKRKVPFLSNTPTIIMEIIRKRIANQDQIREIVNERSDWTIFFHVNIHAPDSDGILLGR